MLKLTGVYSHLQFNQQSARHPFFPRFQVSNYCLPVFICNRAIQLLTKLVYFSCLQHLGLEEEWTNSFDNIIIHSSITTTIMYRKVLPPHRIFHNFFTQGTLNAIQFLPSSQFNFILDGCETFGSICLNQVRKYCFFFKLIKLNNLEKMVVKTQLSE